MRGGVQRVIYNKERGGSYNNIRYREYIVYSDITNTSYKVLSIRYMEKYGIIKTARHISP